jgi:hypothetical protein
MANKRLNATITIGGAITSSLKGAFGSTTNGLREIGKEIREVAARQKLLGKSIEVMRTAGKNVDGLRNSYAQTIVTIDRLRNAQDRLNKSQQRYEKAKVTAGKLTTAGVTMGATGAVMGGVLSTGVKSAIKRENEINIIKNSGLSAADQHELISAASNSKQFGVSVTDAFKTIRELQASLGSAHHAVEALPLALKAKSGLQLYNRQHAGHEVGEDAMYSLAKIADERGGATSAEEMRKQMNAAFKGITSSQGKVSAEDWLAAQRGAKAAGIGATNEAFFGDSFMVQALGAPQYGKALSTLNNAWIGGHQDAHKFTNMLKDGLLDPSKVKLKNGLVTGYTSDALYGNKLLIQDQQAWVEKYLMPLAKKKHIDLSDSAAVQKFTADYTSNTNAGNVIFQRLFNHVAIDRDRGLYGTAHDAEQSDLENQQSTAGKMDNARARFDDAQTRVGNVLIPALATSMEKLAGVLESVNKWADENPRLMQAVVMGLGGMTVGLIAAAPVLAAAGGALTLMASIRLARTVSSLRELETAAGGVSTATAGAGKGILGFIGKLGVAAGLVGVALEVAKAAGLPDVDKKQGEDDVRKGNWFAASTHLSAGDFLSAGWRHMTGQDKPDAMPKPALPQSAAPAMPKPALPAIPQPAARSAGTTQDNRSYSITFHQQPGQSGADAAHAVSKMLGAPPAALGSGLYDSGF